MHLNFNQVLSIFDESPKMGFGVVVKMTPFLLINSGRFLSIAWRNLSSY